MIEIKKCSAENVKFLQMLSITTYTETFGGITTDENMQAYLDYAYNLNRLENELSREATEFYVVYVNGAAAGYIKTNDEPFQSDVHDKDALELERIYVLKKFQGQGIGTMLLEKAIEIAKKREKEYIWLGVWEHNEKAKKFYKRNGFYRIGEHNFIMGDDVAVDWILRKDLF